MDTKAITRTVRETYLQHTDHLDILNRAGYFSFETIYLGKASELTGIQSKVKQLKSE